ncbi:hypothetical protein VUR80DRAFT_9329 [Thermomyces stellatus]
MIFKDNRFSPALPSCGATLPLTPHRRLRSCGPRSRRTASGAHVCGPCSASAANAGAEGRPPPMRSSPISEVRMCDGGECGGGGPLPHVRPKPIALPRRSWRPRQFEGRRRRLVRVECSEGNTGRASSGPSARQNPPLGSPADCGANARCMGRRGCAWDGKESLGVAWGPGVYIILQVPATTDVRSQTRRDCFDEITA